MIIKATFKNARAVSPKLLPSYYREDKPSDSDATRTFDIDAAEALPPEQVLKLKALAKAEMDAKAGFAGVSACFWSAHRVAMFQAQPDAAELTLYDLPTLLAALKLAVEKTSPKRKWLYREMGDGIVVPAYVAGIVKHTDRHDRETSVQLTLAHTQGGKLERTTISFYKHDISAVVAEADEVFSSVADPDADGDAEDAADLLPKPKKAKRLTRVLRDVLASRRLLLETPERFEEYRSSIGEYFKWHGKSGVVAKAAGDAFYVNRTSNSYRDDDNFQLVVKACDPDDVPSDMVLDEHNPEKVKFGSCWDFWTSYERNDNFQLEPFWGAAKPQVPFHPYILAFDLRRHQHVWLHPSRLADRQYEAGILDKLVLPERDKKFLDVLVGAAGLKMDDIVAGKSGGVFVLSQGAPGTGKTLTAELHSEAIRKPLYSVQCSQLGIQPEEIEKRLRTVLDRAARWQAVLLMDEADVYIRARGTDVQHNAIVGVMLRVIEYYSGLMFMTTNLDSVDDAIKSRATAVVHYKPPGTDMLPELWRVLGKQFGVALSTGDCRELAREWPNAVGRDVKNLCKLARFTSHSTGGKATADTVREVAQFSEIGGRK